MTLKPFEVAGMLVKSVERGEEDSHTVNISFLYFMTEPFGFSLIVYTVYCMYSIYQDE